MFEGVKSTKRGRWGRQKTVGAKLRPMEHHCTSSEPDNQKVNAVIGRFQFTRRDLVGLIGSIGICLVVFAAGGAITATSAGSWYQQLNKPSYNPPDWVFGPVWTALYILMAIAAWRVWRGERTRLQWKAIGVFALQLGLNLVWTFLFFGMRRIDLALIEILILLLAIMANAILFYGIDRWAGVLFAPYLLWVAYAVMLNGSLWLLN